MVTIQVHPNAGDFLHSGSKFDAIWTQKKVSSTLKILGIFGRKSKQLCAMNVHGRVDKCGTEKGASHHLCDCVSFQIEAGPANQRNT